MTIAITGATGQLGRLVVDRLKRKLGADGLVALVRSPEKAADLGVPARAFDYAKPETLGTALAGVDTLLLISSNEMGQRVAQHRNVVAAAKQAGVKHVVYTSILRADTSEIGLANDHKATEAAIKESGIPYTILRNSWYTENYDGAVKAALAHGAIVGSAGSGRISAASRADYADAAVAVLTSPGHAGQVYELAGDDAFTLAELAAEVSRQSGREIPYKDLPVADYAGVLAGVGLPKPVAEMIAGWETPIGKGALFDSGRQLSKLIGRPTTPMATGVAAALK